MSRLPTLQVKPQIHGAWSPRSLEGDKDYEKLFERVSERLVYSVGDLRDAMKFMSDSRDGVEHLIDQLDEIGALLRPISDTFLLLRLDLAPFCPDFRLKLRSNVWTAPTPIGARGHIYAYPLDVGGEMFYFDFPSRRKGSEWLEGVHEDIIKSKLRCRLTEKLRQEEEDRKSGKTKRSGARRMAVVEANKGKDHNYQLLKVVRWQPEAERPKPCRPGDAPPKKSRRGSDSSEDVSSSNSSASSASNSSDDSGSDSGSGRGGGQRGKNGKKGVKFSGRAEKKQAVAVVVAPRRPVACIENTGKGAGLGQYKVLNRIRYRAEFAPDSTPGLFMTIGSLITLIERLVHDEPTEEELALPLSHPRIPTITSRDGQQMRAIESGRTKSGWFYTDVGVTGATIQGPLTNAEASEVRKAKDRHDREYAKEIAAKSKKEQAMRDEMAARSKYTKCKSTAEHSGWVYIDEVEYKGCGKSAIEVRKLIRFFLKSLDGQLEWFYEGADNKAGDRVDSISIAGSAVEACDNPVLADRERLPHAVRLELPPSLIARLQQSGDEEEAEQLEKVWKEIDEDGSGELDIDEFIELVTKLREMLNMKPLPEAKARKQFKKLDADGGGTLDQVSRPE